MFFFKKQTKISIYSGTPLYMILLKCFLMTFSAEIGCAMKQTLKFNLAHLAYYILIIFS